ncbi:MAG: hypothetical protein R3275_08300 [Saprospiraceae bacterium]|nr:hypothetical protein [Saprospiraceae bacterium]
MTRSSGRMLANGPLIAVLVSIVAVMFIYFGLPMKDDDQRQIEKSRALNFEKVNVSLMLREAKAELDEETRVYLAELEGTARDDDELTENLKTLSREWFNRGEWILAGYYAEMVADVDSSASSYAMAGNTYTIGMQRYQDEDLAEHAKRRAIRNYEKAISVDSEELEYRINLAVTYAERPDKNNPMKGVMMLLDLEKNFPGDNRVQNTLAYYGLQTGQIEKARQRLTEVLQRDPDDQRANCLMARLMKQNGEAGYEEYEKKCNKN